MSITIAEHHQELMRKRCCQHNDQTAKRGYAADNADIEESQFLRLMTPRKCRNKYVREEITQNRKDHCQPPKRADFRNRARTVGKDADQKNCYLTLDTIEHRIWCEFADESDKNLLVLRIGRRLQIDNTCDVMPQHQILHEKRDHCDRDCGRSIQQPEERDYSQQPEDCRRE